MFKPRSFIALAVTAAALTGGGAQSALAVPVPPDTGVVAVETDCALCPTAGGTHDGPAPVETPSASATPLPVDLPADPAADPAADAPADPPEVEAVRRVTPRLTVVGGQVREGDVGSQDVQVHLRLDRSTTAQVAADWSTADGSATAGEDYDARSGHVEFAPGETDKVVAVPVNGDVVYENDETFQVVAGNVDNAELVAPGSDRVTITNDDRAPVLRIDYYPGYLPLTGKMEGNPDDPMAWANNYPFVVRVDGPTALPVDFDFATVDRSAIAGEDYTARSGHKTLTPALNSGLISAYVTSDSSFEPDEQFEFVLSNATNVSAVVGSGVVTIYNDDPRPRVGPRVDERPRLRPERFGMALRDSHLTAARRLQLQLTCPAGGPACAGKLKLLAGSLTAGSASYAVQAGDSDTVTVAVSRKVRRLIRHRGHVRMTLRTKSGLFSRFTLAADDLNPQPLPPKGR